MSALRKHRSFFRTKRQTTPASIAGKSLVALWTAWGLTAVWLHKPIGAGSYTIIALLPIIFLATFYKKPKYAKALLLISLVIITLWFVAMQPSNNRPWQDEVLQQLSYEQQGNIITINNVRNFDWLSENDYIANWQTRRYDLSKLQTLDLFVSIWDNENIAHTLLSFGFSDGQRLVFSIEIRKEIGEDFSSIGGFFRQYELTIVAADEKDIIYTRSNVRNERVYLYPLNYPKPYIRKLFMSYLQAAEALKDTPAWYNTLTANCTTEIFKLIKDITPYPRDYRILVSGRLPAYLHELGVINQQYSLQNWKEMAFINPKVAAYSAKNPISSQQFSQKIRENLPPATEPKPAKN